MLIVYEIALSAYSYGNFSAISDHFNFVTLIFPFRLTKILFLKIVYLDETLNDSQTLIFIVLKHLK